LGVSSHLRTEASGKCKNAAPKRDGSGGGSGGTQYGSAIDRVHGFLTVARLSNSAIDEIFPQIHIATTLRLSPWIRGRLPLPRSALKMPEAAEKL
jgi:hypothetical protein